MKKFIIQKCPKCTAPIQKKEGCNHMTCFKCHFMFCWLCRARYTRKHYQSYNCFGCPRKQFTQDQPYDRPKWKKYGGIVCDFFTWILIIPVLPLIMLYYGIGAPLLLCKK